jgi:hypothetical protein
LPKKLYRRTKWLRKKNPRLPKLIIEQSIDYENNKTVKYFIKDLIDFEMLKTSLVSLSQKYSMGWTNIDKINDLRIQFKIDQNTYTFKCFTPNILVGIPLTDTSVVSLYPYFGSRLNISQFIENLKVAKNVYFKITKVGGITLDFLEDNPINEIDWNTYYIDLNGSFEALSF